MKLNSKKQFICKLFDATNLQYKMTPENFYHYVSQHNAHPALKFRIQSELLENSDIEKEIPEFRQQISQSAEVKKLFVLMHPEGYWVQKNSRTGEYRGQGLEYGAYATTHYILSYLAELGLTKEDPQIELAAERYLGLQKPDGDFLNHMSCLNGINLRTFIRLGYKEHRAIRKLIDLCLETRRFDGGYLCEMHEKRSRNKKSCFRGSVKMLLAFSELPEYYQHPRCIELIDYFLSRNGILSSQLTGPVNSDVVSFSFPPTWKANTWEILYALSKMGYGRDNRLTQVWQMAESRKSPAGLYLLDQTPPQIPIKFGKKGAQNEWISFYMFMARKYRTML